MSESEHEFHLAIEKIFDNLLDDALEKYSVERVAVKLGEVLRGAEKSVVDIVVPGAITKHAHPRKRQGSHAGHEAPP